jgi:hypothetical protein
MLLESILELVPHDLSIGRHGRPIMTPPYAYKAPTADAKHTQTSFVPSASESETSDQACLAIPLFRVDPQLP